MQRVNAIARKEFRHLVRDRQTLSVVLALPVIMMFLFGYALNADLKEAKIWLEAPVFGPVESHLSEALDASPLFHVTRITRVLHDPEEAFRSERVKALIRLPVDLDRQLQQGGARVQVLVDGSDPNAATQIARSAEAMVQDVLMRYMGLEASLPVVVLPRVLYNPKQESALYFVPGLMATLLIMVCALLTSIAVAREKENRTLQQMLISPVRPSEVIAGKLLPYVVLATVIALLILFVGRTAFGVGIRGDAGFLALCTLVYIVTALGIGLLISTAVQRQQHAMLIALGVTMMPTVLLSGFIFPVASLPVFLQWLAHIIPAYWYLQLVRGVMLKATGLAELWFPLTMLALEGLAFFALAVAKFRRAA